MHMNIHRTRPSTFGARTLMNFQHAFVNNVLWDLL